MQCDACVVRQRYACVRVAVALDAQLFKQFGVERFADAATVVPVMNIDSGFDRPLISRPFAVRPSVGIADASPVLLGYEPSPVLPRSCDSGRELFSGWRLRLK